MYNVLSIPEHVVLKWNVQVNGCVQMGLLMVGLDACRCL